MNLFDVIKRPLVTEKSTLLRESGGVYVFEVDGRADKPIIKKSVEALFNVKVGAVRTCVVPGKTKRFGKGYGRVKAWKKAIVTLTSGKIELFEGV